MKRVRILAVLFALILAVMLLPVAVSADNGSELCWEYAPQLTNDTFRYLDEIYIQKYPAMALRWTQGTNADKQVLQKLADTITAGCKTNREKAEAVAGWIKRNIRYQEGSGYFYAIDVFYAREGNCASYAQLMQTLMRLEGIPAVYGDGYRMDTKSMTVEQMRALDVGHAWCFVYLDGHWELYDPLWEGAKGLTDRDYIAKNYYLETVDRITPVYGKVPAVCDPQSMFMYQDGKFLAYNNGTDSWPCNTRVAVNNTGVFCFSICDYYYDDPRGNQVFQYLDAPERMQDMIPGELYTNGWFGNMQYAYENGVQAHGVILERDGERYFMNQASAYRMLAPEGDYYIENGYLWVEPGYSGKIAEPYWCREYADNPEYRITWSILDSSPATVDQNGVITCTEAVEYTVTVRIELERLDEDGAALLRSDAMYIGFYPNERVADYTDHVEQEHTCSFAVKEVVAPSCNSAGYTVYACECGEEYQDDFRDPAHTFGQWTVIVMPTKTNSGVLERVCALCDYHESQELKPGSDVSGYPLSPELMGHECRWKPVQVIEATCLEDGFTVYVCEICGQETAKDFTPGSHRFGKWETLVQPAIGQEGFQIRVCELCGEVEENVIPAPTMPAQPSTIPPTTPPAVIQPPTTQPPATKPPTTQPPVTQVPATQAPTTQPVTTLPPTTQAPTTQPATEPTTQAPTTQPVTTMPLQTTAPGETVLTEEDNGIMIQLPAAQAGEVRLEVTVISGSETEQITAAVTQLAGQTEQIKAFDISLQHIDGAAVQPDGTVTVSIPIPEGWEPQKLRVYYVADNGAATDMQAAVSTDGKYMQFQTDHFSCYALAQLATEDAPPEASPLPWIILGVIGALALAAGGYLLWRKKKN